MRCQRRGFARFVVFVAIALLGIAGFAASAVHARAEVSLWLGQTLHVPAYSHVVYGDKSKRGHKTINLATTLSIRNTSSDKTITLEEVRYIDTGGNEVRRFLEEPVTVPPLAAKIVTVDESDTTGGEAPRFIVRWSSDKAVTAPIVQAIMIGAQSTQGISFVIRGEPVSGRRP